VGVSGRTPLGRGANERERSHAPVFTESRRLILEECDSEECTCAGDTGGEDPGWNRAATTPDAYLGAAKTGLLCASLLLFSRRAGAGRSFDKA
jgi:hypothetical protein